MRITKRNSNKGRKIDGKTKKRLLYLRGKECEQCGKNQPKSLRILPLCYIHRIRCLNCIKFNLAPLRYKYIISGYFDISYSTIALIHKKRAVMNQRCYYCGEHRFFALKFDSKGWRTYSRLKCYNCTEADKPRKYDEWVDTNFS